MKHRKQLVAFLIALALVSLPTVQAEEIPSYYASSIDRSNCEALAQIDSSESAYIAAITVLDASASVGELWYALASAQHGYSAVFATSPSRSDEDVQFVYFLGGEAWQVSTDLDSEVMRVQRLCAQEQAFTDDTALASMRRMGLPTAVLAIDGGYFWQYVIYLVIEIQKNSNAYDQEQYAGAGEYPREADANTDARLAESGRIEVTVSVKLELVEGMTDFRFCIGEDEYFGAEVLEDGTVTGTTYVSEGGIYIVRLYFKLNGEALFTQIQALVPALRPDLKKGDKGDHVLALQQMLKQIGIHKGSVDGDFGPQTETSVRAYQIQASLPETGVVDEATWRALTVQSCTHEYGETTRSPLHPHYLTRTCPKCGSEIAEESAGAGYSQDCCVCTEHIFRDEDYSVCVRCGETFDVCLHENAVWSEHPHIAKYCPDCGIQLGDTFNPNGHLLTGCKACFPQGEPNKDLILSLARASEAAYLTREFVENSGNNEHGDDMEVTRIKPGVVHLKGTVYQEDGTPVSAVDGYRIDGQESLPKQDIAHLPDTLIQFEETADDVPVMTITFEGTDWGELLADLALGDLDTYDTEDGLHSGFSRAADTLYKYLGTETFDVTLPDGETMKLSEAFHEILHEGGYLRLSGHSLGGAVAQCFAYRLLQDGMIEKDKLSVYTYATPIPFTHRALADDRYRDLNVFNFINVSDMVPDVGVTQSNSVAERIAETLGNAMAASAQDQLNGGLSGSGTTMGTNLYLTPKEEKALLAEHDMWATYYPLLEAYLNGETDAYEFDTDVLYTQKNDTEELEAFLREHLIISAGDPATDMTYTEPSKPKKPVLDEEILRNDQTPPAGDPVTDAP